MSANKITSIFLHAAIITISLVATSGKETAVIPRNKSRLPTWFRTNIKPYAERKNTLDPELGAAEAQPRIIKVRQDGSGEFKTITEALNAVPPENKKRVILSIGGGIYKEKIKIERSKRFITFYGAADAMPNITFSGTAKEFGTVDSASVIVESDYFMAVNVIFVNGAPKPDGKRVGAQAVALRISGTKAAFYNCKFIGFQDTLCDDRGTHFFKDCHIEGTVDFIFGSGKSLYLSTVLHAIGDDGPAVITAHARETNAEDNGFAFVHCKVMGTGKGSFLGRAWRPSPRVVFAYTEMTEVVNPGGWSENQQPERARNAEYGEYKCSGPGSTHMTNRFRHTKQLTDAQARTYLVLDYIEGYKWVLPPPRL